MTIVLKYRGFGLFAAGIAFLVIGFRDDRPPFMGLGVVFLVLGLAALARNRRRRPPAP